MHTVQSTYSKSTELVLLGNHSLICTSSLTFLYSYIHYTFPISANRDFSPVNTPVIFLPGDSTGNNRCVNITILDDEIVEENEDFKVVLSSTSDIQVFGITSANVTIIEDPFDSKIDIYFLT